jgi:hypothetical protein
MKKTLFLCSILGAAASGCVVPGLGTSSGPASQGGYASLPARRGLFGLSDIPAASPSAGEAASLGKGAFAPLPSPSAARGRAARPGTAVNREANEHAEAFGPRGAARDALMQGGVGRGDLIKVEGNIWRTAIPATRAFAHISRALSQTYLLSRVDRRNLSLQTDWDKFFIDGRLFRNRLVISVFPVGARQTEVILRNNLEYFSGQPGRPEDMSESAWLPSPDITDEVARLVDAVNLQIQNAALQRGERNLR